MLCGQVTAQLKRIVVRLTHSKASIGSGDGERSAYPVSVRLGCVDGNFSLRESAESGLKQDA